jgi:hypothetical protein
MGTMKKWMEAMWAISQSAARLEELTHPVERPREKLVPLSHRNVDRQQKPAVQQAAEALSCSVMHGA